jgi:aryl-alcohol dehydrogenase-like predicted oxidoreductase
MRYRPLGRTAWEVSEVGLGTYPLGGALETSGSYWSGPSTYGAVTPDEAVATIHAGLEGGVTFIDTAPNYGHAEESIGRALRDRPDSLRARRCYVATKCGEHVRPAPGGTRERQGPPELARDFSRAALRESLATSRRRLGVERLDLVFLHSPRPDELAQDPLGLLVELRDRGEIEHVGESAGPVERALQLVERDGRAEVVEIGFNLLQPAAAPRLLPLAADRGVGIVIRSPLASGYLTGTIAEDHVFAPDDHRSTTPREQIVRQVQRARAFHWLVAEGIARSLSEAALRYILSFPAVSAVIPGAMRREEFLANLEAAAAGPLPAPALARIEAVQRDLGLLR